MYCAEEAELLLEVGDGYVKVRVKDVGVDGWQVQGELNGLESIALDHLAYGA
jgi:hypothetical protein